MKFLVPIIIIAIVLANFTSFAGELKSFEENVYGVFNHTEYIGLVIVTVKGSAEKIGLHSDDLSDFLMLRLKNSLGSLEKLSDRKYFSMSDDESNDNKMMTITLDVWTVGDDYPIAFHVHFQAGPQTNVRLYEDQILGYGSRINVPLSIKQSITDLVDTFAIKFYRIRGEL